MNAARRMLAVIVGALALSVGPAIGASADAVPASCPHLTVEKGLLSFTTAAPTGAPAPIGGQVWDCAFPEPEQATSNGSGVTESIWQLDDSGATLSDFVALTDTMMSDGSWHFGGGSTRNFAGESSSVPANSTRWPSTATNQVDEAVANFDWSGGTVTISWQASQADGSNIDSARWGFGTPASIAPGSTDSQLERYPYIVLRNPHVSSWVLVDYRTYSGGISSLPSGTGIAAPSVISDLKTIASAPISPFQTFVVIATGLLLTVLIGYPGFLLSAVISARWDRWSELAKRPAAAIRRVASRRQARWVFWVGIVVASLISAFIDPRFGINWLSFRLYLTLFASFAVFNVGAWFVIARVLRRLEPELQPPELRLRLGSLGVLLLGVVLSRLLSLEPGIVFGLVAGLVFATTLLASRRGAVVLVGTAFAATAGVAAWVIYSVLAFSIGSLDTGVSTAIIEFFGGLTIQGISTLPIALLPLATLDGADLFRWNRAYWAVTYLLASVLFIFVMVNVPGGLTSAPGDYLRWILLYVGFAVLATAVWGIDRLVSSRRHQPTSESEDAR